MNGAAHDHGVIDDTTEVEQLMSDAPVIPANESIPLPISPIEDDFQKPFQSMLTYQSVSSTWAVSFGDLLTLILGFLLAIFAANPPERLPNAPTMQQKPAQPDFLPLGGISLAVQDGEIAGAKSSTAPLTFESFEIPESAFDNEDGELGVHSRREVQEFAAGLNGTVEAAAVESCIASDRTEGWFAASKRALEVRALLAESGIVRSRVAIRIAGSHCKAIRGLPEGAAVRILVGLRSGSDVRG